MKKFLIMMLIIISVLGINSCFAVDDPLSEDKFNTFLINYKAFLEQYPNMSYVSDALKILNNADNLPLQVTVAMEQKGVSWSDFSGIAVVHWSSEMNFFFLDTNNSKFISSSSDIKGYPQNGDGTRFQFYIASSSNPNDGVGNLLTSVGTGGYYSFISGSSHWSTVESSQRVTTTFDIYTDTNYNVIYNKVHYMKFTDIPSLKDMNSVYTESNQNIYLTIYNNNAIPSTHFIVLKKYNSSGEELESKSINYSKSDTFYNKASDAWFLPLNNFYNFTYSDNYYYKVFLRYNGQVVSETNQFTVEHSSVYTEPSLNSMNPIYTEKDLGIIARVENNSAEDGLCYLILQKYNINDDLEIDSKTITLNKSDTYYNTMLDVWDIDLKDFYEFGYSTDYYYRLRLVYNNTLKNPGTYFRVQYSSVPVDPSEPVGPDDKDYTNIIKDVGDKISDKLEETKTGIINGIIDGIKGLFIPSEDFFESYWEDLSTFMKSKLGFLWEVITFIPNLFQNIIDMCQNALEVYIVEIPEISVPLGDEEYVILESFTFNVYEYFKQNDELLNLYTFYLNMIDFLTGCALISYGLAVIQDIFGVHLEVPERKNPIGFNTDE